jgi:hypothetical protein
MMIGKYHPLVAHLAARRGGEALLTFAAIETIIGDTLPLSAYSESKYWSGTQFPHTRALLILGWRGEIERGKGRVRFTRVASISPAPRAKKGE